VEDCYAGTRGIDIAANLASEVEKHSNIKVMLNTTAVACYKNKKIGVNVLISKLKVSFLLFLY
jgi:sarcosine oxidase subunit alpha